jgi:hypothetical protein
LPLAEGHIRRWLQDACATLPGMLEMRIYVLDMHVYVLAYFVGARRPKLGTLTAQHYSALGNVELRMRDNASWSRST